MNRIWAVIFIGGMVVAVWQFTCLIRTVRAAGLNLRMIQGYLRTRNGLCRT